MNYHRSNVNRKRAFTVFFLVAVVFFVYFHGFLLHVVSRASLTLLAPIMRLENGAKNAASPLFAFFSSKQHLEEENKRLQGELEALSLSLVRDKLIAEENRLLKEMLGRLGERDATIAAVLAKPSETPYDTLILDAGESNEIEEGDVVMVEGSFIVGYISEVYADTSKATLFSNPGAVVKVWIGDTGIVAEAKGKGGGNFEVLLPRDVFVKEGDIAAIPELNIDILGVVGAIEKEPNDSFQTVLLKTPVNMSTLMFVQIVKPFSSSSQH